MSDRSDLPTDRATEPGATLDEPQEIAGVRLPADPRDVEHNRAAVMRGLFGSEAPPVTIGRFEIESVAGEGAMGRVYAARDPELDRKVALKVIRTDLEIERADKLRARLLREARAAAQLSHPNVVEVFDVGAVRDDVYVAMEFVEGQTLREWLGEPRPWRDVLDRFVQAGEGLAAAHAVGIVHRDFKPANVMLDAGGRARVADFGLATAVAPSQESSGEGAAPAMTQETSGDAPDLGSRLTRTGATAGTLAYMPPEQMVGVEVDPRSDQFAFCVSLYEGLFGVRPFSGAHPAVRLTQMTTGELVTPVRGEDVPTSVRAAVTRGLHAETEQRFESMSALLAALRVEAEPRRRWPLLAAAIAAAGIGLYAAWPATPCGGADERLHEVWNDDRRREVTSALVATGVEYADATASLVDVAASGYGGAWTRAYADACKADDGDTLLDRRMRCLDRGLSALDAVLTVLGSADAEVLEHAVEAVVGLPNVGACNAVEALATPTLPPTDAQQAAQLDNVQRQLARSRALQVAGKVQEAKEALDALMPSALSVEYAPALARVHFHRGQLLLDLGRPREGAESLQAAYFAALDGRDDVEALRAATRLIKAYGDGLSEPDAAAQWEATARALLSRSGAGDLRRAELLCAVGIVRGGEARYDEALTAIKECIAVRKAALGEESVSLAEALTSLANIIVLQDRHQEALEIHKEAKRVFAEELGPDHPKVTNAIVNIGVAYTALGNYEIASEHYQLAVERYERVYGGKHPIVALTLNNLSNAYSDMERDDKAVLVLRRAVEILEASGRAEHPSMATVLDNLASSLRSEGQLEEALRMSSDALELRRRVYGSEHIEVARSLHNYGLQLSSAHRWPEALVSFRDAARIYEQQLGPDHSLLAYSVAEWGRVLLRMKRYDKAVAAFERSLRISKVALQPGHPYILSAMHDLGMALMYADRLDEARQQLEGAVEMLATTKVGFEQESDAKFDLALALWRLKADHPRAVQLARDALALCEAEGSRGDRPAERIRAWLDQFG